MAWIFLVIIGMVMVFVGVLLWRRRISKKQADFDFRVAMASDPDCIRQQAESARQDKTGSGS